MTKKVLVVDDSRSLRAVVAQTLLQAGYGVVEAQDGNEALQRLAGAPVQLMLCDVNMPGMDGLTLLGRVKALPEHRFMPVVMLTTEGGAELIERGKAAGAKAWLTKPFNPEKLVDVVRRLVGS